MSQNQVVDLALRALMLAAELAAPLLITALVVCGHWMISEAVTFTEQLFAMIPTYLKSS